MRRRLWWWDAAAVAVAVSYATADVVLGLPSDAPALRWVLLGSAAAAVGFMRRFPLAVLAVESGLFVATTVWVPVATGLPVSAVVLALACVAYRHRWRVAAAAAAAAYTVALLTVAGSGVGLLHGSAGAMRVVGLACAVAAPVLGGRYLRGLREATGLAEQRARDAERGRRAEAETARLAERARIAGDLHDIVAHHVSAIALQAGAGHYAATHAAEPEQRLTEAVQALGTIRDSAGQALVELRGLLQVLRGTPAATAGGGPALEPETEIIDAVRRTRAAGVTVEAYVDSRTPQAPLAVRLTAARAVQEGLTNVLKHAGPGTQASTSVVLDADALRIQVTDRGPAGRRVTLPASGHGLTAMQDRVALLGGTMAAGPSAPRGWRVDVSLPLPPRGDR